MAKENRCPQCGKELPRGAPQGLCPSCLLEVGQAHTEEFRNLETADVSPAAGAAPSETRWDQPKRLPKVGEDFGGYRILGFLGKGGMGSVYEAEHLETERRVALKVLDHRLDSPEARQRFLREGRLAASVNHPNSVYVYGTEEIEDTPVISMELVPGGTLEDRVAKEGPLPVTEAVDAILQIIAGLEAAQSVGVLHRDIKPSNCFVDSTGEVKVGDFGLSISTLGRGESHLTEEGTFLGTPAFASPEQLRGDELDLRSDIYSVGVTLYYLLTGKTPFEADNMVRLLATVLERPAESPVKLRPEIPRDLGRGVLSCLKKKNTERFKSYAQMRTALVPFSSRAPTPASLRRRFLAGFIDYVVLSFLSVPWFYETGVLDPEQFSVAGFRFTVSVWLLFQVLWYTVQEGFWGASLGKALCQIRVVRPDRNIPSLAGAALRALIFVAIPAIPYVILGCTGLTDPSGSRVDWVTQISSYSPFIVLLLFFSTARKRNGFAAVHDLLSDTRVILKWAPHQARQALPTPEKQLSAVEGTPQLGPYYVLENLAQAGPQELVLGYDTRLLRKVWIRRLPTGEPAVAQNMRKLGRLGRLRWLNGKRSGEECWDVYEAVSGTPLLSLLGARQPWGKVRYWLLDLADELQESLKDASLPAVLSLDRVWITADGRAKLLDFPAPGLDEHGAQSKTPEIRGHDFASVKLFLNQIAVVALEGSIPESGKVERKIPAVPLPLHARSFLESLSSFQTPEILVEQLKSILYGVASVSRWRRLGLVAGCSLPSFLTFLIMLTGVIVVESGHRLHPEIDPLDRVLLRFERLQEGHHTFIAKTAQLQEALKIYLVAHYRETISNPAIWKSFLVKNCIRAKRREIAEQIVATHPSPTEAEIAEAEALLEPYLFRFEKRPRRVLKDLFFKIPLFIGLILIALLIFVIVPSLIFSPIFGRDLFLHSVGIAVVNAAGSRASRLRIFLRILITWSPMIAVAPALIMVFLVTWTTTTGGVIFLALPCLLVLAGALWSVLTPSRSLQDKIAGTYLVPR